MLDAQLNFLFQFGQRYDPNRDDYISQAYDVAVDGENIIVVDRGLKLVKIYDDEGRLVRNIDVLTFDDGRKVKFSLPQHLKVGQSGHIYLADSAASRIFVFDKTGRGIHEWETIGYVKDLAILDTNEIITTEYQRWMPGFPDDWQKIGGARRYTIGRKKRDD